MATVQTGRKKITIVDGAIVEGDEGIHRPPPSQPYNMFNEVPQTAVSHGTTETTDVPLAVVAVVLLLAEALFFDWIVVLSTVVILILLLAYLIVRN